MQQGHGRAIPLICILLVAAIGLLYGVIWSVSPAMTAGNNGNDLIFLADGVRHMASGQWPHADFDLPIGVLSYLLYWLGGLWLPAMPSYMAMHLLAFILIAPLLVAAAVRLPSWWMRLGLIALVSIIALLPFNEAGPGVCGTDFYASYNRFGAALSLAYLAWAFRAGDRTALDSILFAWAILIALFLKFVFLAVIFAPAAVFFLLDSRWRRIVLFGSAIALLITLAIELATGTVSAYVGDIGDMFAVNSGRSVYFVFSFAYKHIADILLAGLLMVGLLAYGWLHRPRASSFWDVLAGLRDPLAMGAALFGILLAESQSTGGMGLAALLGILAAPSLSAPKERPVAITVLIVAFTTLLAAPVAVNAFQKGTCNLLQRNGAPLSVDWTERFAPDVKVPDSIATSAESLAELWEDSPEQLRPALWDQLFSPENPGALTYLAQWVTVDHAIAAMEEKGEADDLGRTTTLTFADLFGFALDATPPKGTKNVVDVGRTITMPSASEAAAYVDQLDTVFVPRCGLVETVQPDPESPPFSSAYEAALETDFEEIILTPCWSMYRRN